METKGMRHGPTAATGRPPVRRSGAYEARTTATVCTAILPSRTTRVSVPKAMPSAVHVT